MRKRYKIPSDDELRRIISEGDDWSRYKAYAQLALSIIYLCEDIEAEGGSPAALLGKGTKEEAERTVAAMEREAGRNGLDLYEGLEELTE